MCRGLDELHLDNIIHVRNRVRMLTLFFVNYVEKNISEIIKFGLSEG